MKTHEFPQSIPDAHKLIDSLGNRIESEPDKERRRELFLLQIELRDHIIEMGDKKNIS